MNDLEIPTKIKIIYIYYFIKAGILMITGIAVLITFFFGNHFFLKIIVFIIISILTVLMVEVGRGLKEFKLWAFRFALSFSIIEIVSGLSSFPDYISSVVLNIIVFILLLNIDKYFMLPTKVNAIITNGKEFRIVELYNLNRMDIKQKDIDKNYIDSWLFILDIALKNDHLINLNFNFDINEAFINSTAIALKGLINANKLKKSKYYIIHFKNGQLNVNPIKNKKQWKKAIKLFSNKNAFR